MTTPPPVSAMNYPTYLWQMVTDKTGTVFQTLVGNVGDGTPWGVRIWRCPPNAKPELLYFLDQGNGGLYIDDINRRLLFLGTDANRRPFYFIVQGYVYPTDIPQPTIVNINEAQLASVRQSIATTQTMAQSAQATANSAISATGDARAQIEVLRRQVNDLTAKLDAMQRQVNGLLTPSQVADLVWQKIKDVNYLYRLAFLAWPTQSPDPDIKGYVADLVALIRKAK